VTGAFGFDGGMQSRNIVPAAHSDEDFFTCLVPMLVCRGRRCSPAAAFRFLALIRSRSMFIESGKRAAQVFSVLPLPQSKYLKVPLYECGQR